MEDIVVYENDSPSRLAEDFGKRHHLDHKLTGLLQQQIELNIQQVVQQIPESDEDNAEVEDDEDEEMDLR